MSKYSKDLKKEVVRKHLEEHVPVSKLCEEYGIPSKYTIELWIARYREHGEENFCETHGKYTGEFKIEVVEYIYDTGASIKGTAVHFNIPGPNTVKAWKKIYDENGKDALYLDDRKNNGVWNKERKVYRMRSTTEQDKGGKAGGKTKEKMVTITLREPPENETPEAKAKRVEREHAFLKKYIASSQIPEKTLIGAITEMRQDFPLKDILDDIGMPRSTYYYKLAKYNKEDKYFELKCEIKAIFEENKGRYGYRRVTYELQLRGRKVNHKLVQRLMQEMGLKGSTRAVKYSSYIGEVGTIAPNIIARNFHAKHVGEKYGTDVSMFKVNGIKLYLSLIMDMYNGEIVGYDLSRHPNMDQVMRMLNKAFGDVSDAHGAILHSDQGWQYQQTCYQEYLKEKNITQSMSRKATCLDDAITEQLFAAIKCELYYTKEFESEEQFREELDDYIKYYNEVRIKTRLKMSPVQYRLTHETD